MESLFEHLSAAVAKVLAWLTVAALLATWWTYPGPETTL